MNVRLALCLVIVAASSALRAQERSLVTAAQQEPRPLAITNVTVIDVAAGARLPNRTVIVEGNQITATGAAGAVPVPARAIRIDGAGKFLMPGLIDTHVHLALARNRDSLGAIGPLLAHGVTGVRDAGAGGQDAWLVALRDRVSRGEVLGPRMYVSGMVAGRTLARAGVDATTLARQLVDLRVDGLKIRDGLKMDEIRAVLAVAAEARLPVYGHTYDAVNRDRDEVYTLEAIRAGVSGTMHVLGMPQLGGNERPTPPSRSRSEAWQQWWVYYAIFWLHTDPAAEQALIDTMVARGAWLEPTLVTEDWVANPDVYRDSWVVRHLPGSFAAAHEGFPALDGTAREQYRAAFARMMDFVRRFHQAGGRLVAGTDCIPACGYGLNDELRLLVQAGLTPAAAVRAATIDAARVLGWADRLGRVEKGLVADLVLLEADPLQDIRNVSRVDAVVANGRLLDRKQLALLAPRD